MRERESESCDYEKYLNNLFTSSYRALILLYHVHIETTIQSVVDHITKVLVDKY